MALKYPDRIESNNPQAYGIVKATEISGARNATEYGGILDIPDNILSTDGTGNDASLLLWIEDNYVYRLVNWENRRNNKGWQIEYAYIPWDSTAHLNSLTLSGQYYISGQSNGLNGGLPILNSDPGHTFDAVLRVLDSSLTKDENEKLLCITLILSLSNRMGGDGHIFVRTIQTLERDNLTRDNIESPACNKWGTWEKLQGVFEKNVATNILEIDTYTTNGMYSVVSGSTSSVSGFLFRAGDTLLIITVNGYHVFKSGFNPQLTQLVYVLPAGHNPNSEAIEYQLSKLITRTALWNVSTKLWDYHNFQDLTDLGRIKEIKVNDTPLTIDSNKAINLDLDASYLELGLESHIAIALKDKNNSSVLKDIKVLMPFADSSKDGLMMHSDRKYLDLLQNKDHFQAITWSTSFNANNYHNGNYRITGIRTSLNDNLPMQNAADGHSIDCYLKVLDSSLKPTDGSNVSEACVTQILTTSNRVGGDGHIYVRTGEALSGGYSNLSWSTWECLQGVFEENVVNTVDDINTYTTNGMYSGMFVFSDSPSTVGGLNIESGSTFLMVVVNGYAVAKIGLTSQITQLLYILPSGLDGSHGVRPANVYIRTGIQSESGYTWNDFTSFGGGGASSEELNSIKNRLNTAEGNIQTIEGTIQSEKARLDEVRSEAVTNISVTGDATGVKIATEKSLSSAGGDIKIPNADPHNKTAGVVTSEEINALHELDFAAASVTDIAMEKDAEKNTLTFDALGNLGQSQSHAVELTPATTEEAGLMSAADKIKLDSVESTANSASEKATAASTAAQEAKSAAKTAQSTATAAQEKNTAQDARLDNIEARIDPDIAGRVWNEDNGTPKAESYYGSVKALRDLPKRLGLGRYIVKDDRTRRKLDPNDSRKYLDDGSTANLDGTDGQCMWCWNGFYANIWHEGSRLIKAVTFDGPVGNDISIWIPAGGISWLGAGVIDRGDAPFTDKTKWKLCSVINNSEQFRGGGGTALDASKYSKAPADTTPQITMLGMPATTISTTDFGNYARKRGEGWEANWFVARFVVEFLFEIIMGTENSQEAFNNLKDANGLYQGGFGPGVVDIPDWWSYNGSNPVIPTSVGLEAGDGVCLVGYKLPDASGGTYKTFNVPVFFGLVCAGFGNLWSLVRGIIMDIGEEKSLVYVAPSMYAPYDQSTVDDKIMVAECPQVSGWITRKSYRGLCCIATELGGSQNIRYSDQFYTNAETSKGIHFRVASGSSNIGASAGASYTYLSKTAQLPYCSAPLCYFTEDPKIPLSQSIATNS